MNDATAVARAADGSAATERPKRLPRGTRARAIVASCAGALVPRNLDDETFGEVQSALQRAGAHPTRQRVTIGEHCVYQVWRLPLAKLTLEQWADLLRAWKAYDVRVAHSVGQVIDVATGSALAEAQTRAERLARARKIAKRNDYAGLRALEQEQRQAELLERLKSCALALTGEPLPLDWADSMPAWLAMLEQYDRSQREQERLAQLDRDMREYCSLHAQGPFGHIPGNPALAGLPAQGAIERLRLVGAAEKPKPMRSQAYWQWLHRPHGWITLADNYRWRDEYQWEW